MGRKKQFQTSQSPVTVLRDSFTCSSEFPGTHRTSLVTLSPQRLIDAKNANRCKEEQLISRTTRPKGNTGALRVSPRPLGLTSQPLTPQGCLRAEIWAGLPQGFAVEEWPRLSGWVEVVGRTKGEGKLSVGWSKPHVCHHPIGE